MHRKRRKRTLKLVAAKARQKQQQEYIKSVVEPAERLVSFLVSFKAVKVLLRVCNPLKLFYGYS